MATEAENLGLALMRGFQSTVMSCTPNLTTLLPPFSDPALSLSLPTNSLSHPVRQEVSHFNFKVSQGDVRSQPPLLESDPPTNTLHTLGEGTMSAAK